MITDRQAGDCVLYMAGKHVLRRELDEVRRYACASDMIHDIGFSNLICESRSADDALLAYAALYAPRATMTIREARAWDERIRRGPTGFVAWHDLQVEQRPLVPFELERKANIERNKREWEKIQALDQKLRNAGSPKKPKKSDRNPEQANKPVESEDDWAPIKSPLGRGGQDADACAKYNSKYWLHGGDIAYLLRAFSMFEGETPDNAMSFDYLLEKIQVAFEAGTSLQWECAIINTATRDHCGEHWNLALWRLHRGRLQFTQWEPYDHGRYSKHIKESVVSAFPEGAVTYHTFNVGVQKRGDGWSCGYICTWWQLVVLKLLRDQCAPRSWDNTPLPPPLLDPSCLVHSASS